MTAARPTTSESRPRPLTDDESIVWTIAVSLGFNHLMELAERLWHERAIRRGIPGTELTIGPCARELVPCPHPPDALSANGHCDWCGGTNRVTARVRRAIEETSALSIDPVTLTDAIVLVRALREWLAREPRELRLSLTHEQVRGIFQVMDDLVGDE